MPELVQVDVHPLQVTTLLGHLAEVVGELKLSLKCNELQMSNVSEKCNNIIL